MAGTSVPLPADAERQASPCEDGPRRGPPITFGGFPDIDVTLALLFVIDADGPIRR